MTFDPRTIATPTYDALNNLRNLHRQDETRLKQQKDQAVELYTYLSTWGMMRLKAEEMALPDGMMGKRQVVQKFFDCLQRVSGIANLSGQQGLETLKNLGTDEYLGITGLGLALAQEFSFWATAVYWDIKGE
ncbi:MAG: hypothetical protein ACKO9G_15455 [Dolichospermum sp.]